MKPLAIILLSLAMLLAPVASRAEPSASSQQSVVKATLVAEHTALTQGVPFDVGIVLEPQPGWHTYWENPGDAGMPTMLTWTLPSGFSASAIDWPAPARLKEGPLVTHAYERNVFLPVTITPPAALDPQTPYPVPIRVKAEWLVCKDICIPESAELQITLLTSSHPEPTPLFSTLFERHRKHHPQVISEPLHYHVADKQATISLPLETLHVPDIYEVTFFPREQNVFNYANEQKLSLPIKASPQLTIDLTADTLPEPLSGILSIYTSKGMKNYAVTLSPDDINGTNGLSFAAVLLFALLGGLVLNLMPCVLPVLSLKALAIAKKAGKKHEHVVGQGIAYTLGIMVSFGLVAGVLLALRQAGESVGWGYQMQSPAFVGFLIYLLFMVGLSLSGVFHLPVLLGNIGGDIANESSVRGSFFTGVLATAVATPCTAPFMASAVGAALSMPTWQALLVFEVLGFGLALPFLMISLFPLLRRFLPKPGAWMDTFKQLLAFPMYASVIWLMWVLTLQTGAGGMVVALASMLAFIIAIWMKSLFADGSAAYRACAVGIYALVLVLSLPMLNQMDIATAALPEGHAEHDVDTVDYSKEKLAKLRKYGTPVFVDATAAWCITCQINARVALHTDRVMAEFKKRHITLMIADWTRRNDEITEFLSGFGYKGVPLCVFYPAGGEPVVLPQLLTEDIVLKTIKGE